MSGGIDSSAIVCSINRINGSRAGKTRQLTFSAFAEDPSIDESNFVRLVASSTGVKNYSVVPTGVELEQKLRRIVWHQDQPFASSSIFAQWKVFELAKSHGVKVMLDGQGADELCGGYVSAAPHFFIELMRKWSLLTLLKESRAFAKRQGLSWSQLMKNLLRHEIARSLPRNQRVIGSHPWLDHGFFEQQCETRAQEIESQNPYPTSEVFNRHLFHSIFYSGLPALLRYEDRNSMAFSIESRVPFLDHRLVDHVLSVPAKCKIRDGQLKWLLRRAVGELIPGQIRERDRKLGFATPEAQWQQDNLKPMVYEAIESRELEPFLNVKKARQYFADSANRDQLDFVPWRWLSACLWMQEMGVA